jgi:hypothetical protein
VGAIRFRAVTDVEKDGLQRQSDEVYENLVVERDGNTLKMEVVP